MERFVNHLRGKFVTGLFIMIPVGITLFILKFLFSFVDGILGTYLDELFTAITNRDYPVVQGCILIVTLIYVLVNTAVDLAYAYFDPRVSFGKK